MCGIAGIVSSLQSDINLPMLKKMTDALAHRGPDGEGVWLSPQKTAALGHRRLAVIDLSFKAAQPMHYHDRYSIVFNGEIYNYTELKNVLKKGGYQFKTNTDTEVILAAFDVYKEECVKYFDGMFAFAIWDELEQILFAARDRFGEKPFYYFNEKSRFIFASEMKGIWATGIHKTPNPKSALDFITIGQVQNPTNKSQTFFKDIYSLPPSHFLTLHNNKLTIEQYYVLDKETKTKISETEAIEKFTNLFDNSIQKRLRSDIPIGISLSGGIDSASILSTLQKFHPTSIKTFSAVFPGFEKDESSYIDQLTTQFNTEPYSVIPDAYSMIENFEKIIYHQEEPFGSSSVFAQYCVYELAKKNNVSVLLDGQGADEIFAGYHKYLQWFFQELFNRNKHSLLQKERAAFKKNNVQIPFGLKNMLASYLPSHTSIALENREYKKKIQHPHISKDMLSLLKGREWQGIHKPIVTKLNDILYFNVFENGLEELLRYADRNSMAHGCEVRLPFLQHKLVDFVFTLPSTYKIQNGFTKSILRKSMSHQLPKEIVWRTDKVGFEPPQKKWMQSPMMQDYLFEAKQSLVKKNILNPKVLQEKSHSLAAHDPNNFDWRYLCIDKIV